MITLSQLFLHAHITNYTAGEWFPKAQWRPPYLYIDLPDESLDFVRKHYQPAFRELVPTLEVRMLPKPAAKVTAPKTAYPSIKPGAWRDRLDGLD